MNNMLRYIVILSTAFWAILITSCDKKEKEEIVCITQSFTSHDLYAELDCIDPYKFWIERCFYKDKNGDETFVDHEYKISANTVSAGEKQAFNIDVIDYIVNLPCYRLLHNGLESDILLFCENGTAEGSAYPPTEAKIRSRRIYAYSLSLKQLFVAHRIYLDCDDFIDETTWDEYEYHKYMVCPIDYIGLNESGVRDLIRYNDPFECAFYASLIKFGEFCDYTYQLPLFFSKDMDILMDGIGMIVSKFGRLGIKDVDFPTDDLVRTEVIDCHLGKYKDDYRIWYNEMFSIHRSIIEEGHGEL